MTPDMGAPDGAAMTRSEQTLGRALAHARNGWPVFPCLPGSKQPATRHGFKDATTDAGQIRAWWHALPAANLAIATGLPGPDVLDVDQHGPAGNGFAALRQLRQAGLLKGAFAIVATPSGGLHAYFRGTAQPSGRLPACHLDFKAAGGYVLAPPSVVNGQPYTLLARRTGPRGALDWSDVTRLLAPPEPVPSRIRTAEPGDLGALTAWVEQLGEGNRNAGLFWAACRLVESGHVSELDELAAAAARTGLGHREIARTIASAQRCAGPEITT
jgi:hypothetical protein